MDMNKNESTNSPELCKENTYFLEEYEEIKNLVSMRKDYTRSCLRQKNIN